MICIRVGLSACAEWAAGIQLRNFFRSLTDSDWYLSSNGTDTSTCGHNVSSACKTLDWLLDRFYTTSDAADDTLSLVTDTSLTIQKDLLVCTIPGNQNYPTTGAQVPIPSIVT